MILRPAQFAWGGLFLIGTVVALAFVVVQLASDDPALQTSCEAPRLWNGPNDTQECLERPRVCPDGSDACSVAPHLWTNTKPFVDLKRL